MEGITLCEKLNDRLLKAAIDVNYNADKGDLNLNHTNYGAATACASILKELGHKVEIDCWEDKGFLRISEIAVSGKTTEF